MSPRPYRLGQRQASADQTRARIVAATRELLADPSGIAAFTIDAVAKQAGVARMTVYYQFGGKPALLEALFDDLAARGHIEQLKTAFQEADPLTALETFVGTFTGFYATDRLVIRRLNALAALDPEVDRALTVRGGWRRDGLRVLLGRIAATYGKPADDAVEELLDVLHMLTSFETFDRLAGEERTPEAVAAILRRIARAAIGI